LDFAIRQRTDRVGAGPRRRPGDEGATRRVARRVGQGVAPAVEAEAEDHLGRVDAVPPEELHRLVNLGQVGVRRDNCCVCACVCQ
jgi:hypothetical protein